MRQSCGPRVRAAPFSLECRQHPPKPAPGYEDSSPGCPGPARKTMRLGPISDSDTPLLGYLVTRILILRDSDIQ